MTDQDPGRRPLSAEGAEAMDWPDPVPLEHDAGSWDFPMSAFSDTIMKMGLGLAKATQTDWALPGVAALGVLAAATGGRAIVEARPGWQEPLNLFTVTVARPGERKSAVLRAMTEPLLAVEKELVRAGRDARLQAETEREVAMKAAEAAKARAGRAIDGQRAQLTEEAIGLAEMANAITVPPIPRIVADDVTPEACASLLVEQDGRLAIISAEGGIFDIIAGRYSGNVPVLDVWLKGHAGDLLRIDRKGRPPEYVERPALTLCLMVQPDVLHRIAGPSAFRGRGLLARILYAMPQSKVGTRRINQPPPDPEVVANYHALIATLVRSLDPWGGDPARLTFDTDATKLLVQLETDVEARLAPGRELASISDWGSKWLGAVIRIAGLLHLADHPEDGWRHPIEKDTLRRANMLGTYFRAHALRAFDEMRVDPMVDAARYLLEVLRRHPGPVVSRRDLHRSTSRSRFPRASDLDAPIQLLEENCYLRRLEVHDEGGRGRPKSPSWLVNPKLSK